MVCAMMNIKWRKQINLRVVCMHQLEKKLQSWDIDAPREKAHVIMAAKAKGEQVHFATLDQLCRQKNSQLEEPMRKYKGRIVLRGDNVKDEEGFYAVFSEQGTSASQMSAAKFLDAVARRPGCKGEESYAVGAYAQVIQKIWPNPKELNMFPLGSRCPETEDQIGGANLKNQWWS